MGTYPKIVVSPPGPKAREFVKKDEQLISPSYVRYYPFVVESANDCIIKDVDGNEYIDLNAGIGRTGKWFAIEHWNVEPDIICSAKALASGLPIGATISKAKIMDWTVGSHASTFGGNPLSCAAAAAVIETIKEEKLLDNANKQGAYALKRLVELKERSEIVGDVRGKGLMIGIELVEDKDSKKPAAQKAVQVITRAWKRGVAIVTCGASTIRIVPPLTIQSEMLDAALDIVEDTIDEVAKEAF